MNDIQEMEEIDKENNTKNKEAAIIQFQDKKSGLSGEITDKGVSIRGW
jgi:hypothetical protein